MAEPPQVEIKELWKTGDEERSKGCLVVIVPASPRAPHMVIKSGDNRYYGRGAKGVRRLSEGEVARLYARREKWEIDRKDWMLQIVESAPREPAEEFGFLHAAARPVIQSDSFIESRLDSTERPIREILRHEVRSLIGSTGDQPYRGKLKGNPWEMNVEGWSCIAGSANKEKGSPADLRKMLRLDLSRNGELRLFCSSAAKSNREYGLALIEGVISDLTVKLVHLSLRIYALGQYRGPVDVGVAVSGIKGGALFSELKRSFDGPKSTRMDRDLYLKTNRMVQAEKPRKVVTRLLNPLFSGLSDGRVKPFEHSQR